MKKILLVSFIVCASFFQAAATHLMGGQITVSQISGLTYEIKMTAYRDTSGIPIHPTADFRVQDLNSSYDSTYVASHTGMNPFFNGVEVYEYIQQVLFPAPGQYRISWIDCCRNGAILNMSNPLGESMYLMTEVTVDNATTNSTPVFLNPPITLAQKFSFWQYNPLPYDADGDSLAWLMETPLGYNGDTVAGYTMPHADPANPFTLNPLTGEITWMPDSNGHWEASFRVEEYRGGVKIGEIRRDMQIIVVDDTSNWHNIVFGNGSWPQDAQGNFLMNLDANTQFSLTVTATDQDNDLLNIDVQGEPMIQTTNPAQWNIVSNNPGSITGILTWTPDNSQARIQPYTLAFRGYEFHNQSAYITDVTLMLKVNAANGINDVSQNLGASIIFPNPSSGRWLFSFELKQPSEIMIDVFNVTGQKVAAVLKKQMPAGVNLVDNRGMKLNKGCYFVRVIVDGQGARTYPLIIE